MAESNPDKLRERYIRLIQVKGVTSPHMEVTARKLGVDVDALLAEREQKARNLTNIELQLDIASLELDADGMPRTGQLSSWESRILPPFSTLSVSLPELGTCGSIRMDNCREITLAEVLSAGIRLIVEKLAESPARFRHTLPWGICDIELERLDFSDTRKTPQMWSLFGGRNASALKRTIRSLNPSLSIDLVRRRTGSVELMRAEPWPRLDWVWLRVDRWPDGTLRVENAFDPSEDCGPIRPPTHPELPHSITLKYPCSGDFDFGWNLGAGPTPAAHFLRQYSLRQVGELAREAAACGIEAVLCDYSDPRPATDPRASIRSGPEGPAPLPSGTPWPVCPDCGASPSFWESLDFRDTPFAHLLPGTSLSLFVCDRCLEAGEWSICATPVWLPADREAGFVSKGNPMPVLAARQRIDRERSPDHVPETLRERIDAEWPAGLPCGFYFTASGTKAGGIPDYLQADPILFGSDGFLMEFIGQFTSPDWCGFDGFGYLFHSTTTGETVAELQTT